ncbi:MAG: NAD(P)-dependent oxidoreductase [Alphaproteobacteria bacterium]|nr:NAD(P)-dependent oxidoreductase [Alphaproteobacteria bacterium]MDE2493204.1 NAD(P)-dependent oxidoreductase [Alphaproteobacteria bacterium]
MRVVIVGQGSFIAGHLRRAALETDIDVLSFPHDADISGEIHETDTVINFALSPSYKIAEYREDEDCDLRVARAAARAGAHLIMLSTRRVYPDGARWNAREDGLCGGDETIYGRNKARSETILKDLVGLRIAVFRLSNVFGYEYAPDSTRHTFLAQLSRSLRKNNVIRFDMHPDTRRDFIPVEICAGALVAGLKRRVEGVYNIGAGFPVRCGDIADWIRKGFGGGNFVCDPPVVRDEFFLNMEKWELEFGYRPVGADVLQSYCIQLGQKLKCEES